MEKYGSVLNPDQIAHEQAAEMPQLALIGGFRKYSV